MDLETLTIVRGRDAGLPSYNSARFAYGLTTISNFSQLNPDLPREVINDELFKNNVFLLVIGIKFWI